MIVDYSPEASGADFRFASKTYNLQPITYNFSLNLHSQLLDENDRQDKRIY